MIRTNLKISNFKQNYNWKTEKFKNLINIATPVSSKHRLMPFQDIFKWKMSLWVRDMYGFCLGGAGSAASASLPFFELLLPFFVFLLESFASFLFDEAQPISSFSSFFFNEEKNFPWKRRIFLFKIRVCSKKELFINWRKSSKSYSNKLNLRKMFRIGRLFKKPLWSTLNSSFTQL